MSTTLRRITFALMLLGGLLGQQVFATTKVAVGPSTCQPGLVHFPTIQGAVNAVPFNTIILVCPGTYSEQVVISQPLTLQGITDGTGNAAVITVPGGGLVVNANSNVFGPEAVQLLVRNTLGVSISDITVDGTGSGCPAGANRTTGIEFFNVGAPSDGVLAGKIQNVAVRNEVDSCPGLGEGIVSDNSYMTISSNQLHNIDRTGIVISGGKTSVASNTVQTAGLNGVAFDAANQSTVSGNTISTVNQAGFLVQLGTTGAVITKNTVTTSPNAIGIWLLSAFNSPTTGNKVSDVTWGVVLQFSGGDVVQTNTFSEVSADGILDQFSSGGNIVTKNTVNEAAFGVFTDSSVGGDTLVPNSLFNVVVTVDPNPTSLGTIAAF